MSIFQDSGSRRKSSLVEIEMVVHHETDGAFIVSITGERKDAVSLPKSQVEIDWKRQANGRHMPDVSDDRSILGTAVLSMPEWLATKEGLV